MECHLTLKSIVSVLGCVSVCVFEMRSEESHSTFESERNDDNQVNHKPYDRNVK